MEALQEALEQLRQAEKRHKEHINRIAGAFEEVYCTSYCASMGMEAAPCNCGVEALRQAIEGTGGCPS